MKLKSTNLQHIINNITASTNLIINRINKEYFLQRFLLQYNKYYVC